MFSQHKQLVCLDIETVPDRDLIPDWGDKFRQSPYGTALLRSLLFRQRLRGSRTGPSTTWSNAVAPEDRRRPERQILSKFWDYFSGLDARVVTWNGKAFDLPVLRVRSMMYGISAGPWFTRGSRWENYTQRYAPDWHCDLMEQLSDYRSCGSMSLSDIAQAVGLPGKIGGHGSEVESMMKGGRVEEVRAYCDWTVTNLFALYVRWALLTGRTDLAGHDASLQSLVSCLAREREERPHFGEFLDRWHGSDRPTPMLLGAA